VEHTRSTLQAHMVHTRCTHGAHCKKLYNSANHQRLFKRLKFFIAQVYSNLQCAPCVHRVCTVCASSVLRVCCVPRQASGCLGMPPAQGKACQTFCVHLALQRLLCTISWRWPFSAHFAQLAGTAVCSPWGHPASCGHHSGVAFQFACPM
jgi:hypothetical protein